MACRDDHDCLTSSEEERLPVATGGEEAGALAEQLARAEARGVAVTTLCLDECSVECGGCRGTIRRSCAAVGTGQHWLVLVSDEAEALAGEIGSDGDALAIRTRQQLQVDLASWYIRHSTALTAVLCDLSQRQDQVLAPETWATLQLVDTPDRRGSWLDHMRALIPRGAP